MIPHNRSIIAGNVPLPRGSAGRSRWTAAVLHFTVYSFFLFPVFARALPPLPADNRIPASVQATLSAPATQSLYMPNAVAVDAAGRVFVSDGAHNRIVRFTPEGKFDAGLFHFGTETLKEPVGLHVDAQNRLWIADTGNHRILAVKPDDSLDQRFDPPPDDKGRPCDPTDAMPSADGKRLYVADKGNRMLIADIASGKWTARGEFGQGLGQFQWPFMLAIGAEGYVFVTESVGGRVQMLSPQDRWAGMVGAWGVELGQFYRPKGLAVDVQGRLFVSDSTLNVIQVFGPRGAIQGALTDADGNLLRFEHPMGLCFDKAGRLYVVELRANRVAIVTLTAPAAKSAGMAPAQTGATP